MVCARIGLGLSIWARIGLGLSIYMGKDRTRAKYVYGLG